MGGEIFFALLPGKSHGKPLLDKISIGKSKKKIFIK